MNAADALVIFQLVEGYINASWYPSKPEHGKVVPTWNYEIVHAHGTVRIHDDIEWVRRLVSDLTDHHESAVLVQPAGRPWTVTDAPTDYIDRQLRAIVGAEIEISRLEGKRKLSQNRSDDDRIGLARGPSESPREPDHSLGEAICSTM
jgi:transcriptional regulator